MYTVPFLTLILIQFEQIICHMHSIRFFYHIPVESCYSNTSNFQTMKYNVLYCTCAIRNVVFTYQSELFVMGTPLSWRIEKFPVFAKNIKVYKIFVSISTKYGRYVIKARPHTCVFLTNQKALIYCADVYIHECADRTPMQFVYCI